MSKYGAQSAFDTLSIAYVDEVRKYVGSQDMTKAERDHAIFMATDVVKQLRKEHDRHLENMRGMTIDHNTRKAMKNDITTSVRGE
ncbi:hypothetical protein [Exiguobacterium sp. AT1b]|uniref:Uncharacterized protein n=1 Tax=Exiguobacterium sp. (strain ATCC BAA-1283 / AT1b) TaxID=360911 RepID=C4L0N4_EXISA|nr:hypothetical protein [Exiguobacterium sp. AT1b]ACQ68952.1 hypothetical protein EAT1b_0017 [Exiguobacterium sp. AT1b]